MEKKETVLITGGSGFIATHCIIKLIASGYDVRATVRDLGRTNKLNQTISNGLEKYEGKQDLSIDWKVANLMEDDGWEDAIQGCDYVLHVASPVAMELPKNEDEMIRPAVDGTMRVLKAGIAVPSRWWGDDRSSGRLAALGTSPPPQARTVLRSAAPALSRTAVSDVRSQ